MFPISPDQRSSEADIQKRSEACRPQIFGALLDRVACGLRKLPQVELERLPRMADFALWSVATEAFAPGAFLQAIERAAVEANQAVAEMIRLRPPSPPSWLRRNHGSTAAQLGCDLPNKIKRGARRRVVIVAARAIGFRKAPAIGGGDPAQWESQSRSGKAADSSKNANHHTR